MIAIVPALVFAGACTDDHLEQTGEGGKTSVMPPDHTGDDGGGACPFGLAAFARTVGISNPDQRLSLAVDGFGNAFVAGDQGGNFPDLDHVAGVVELTASGRIVGSIPFGSLVAIDARGDLVIAGAFAEQIDLGLGIPPMKPTGNIDVFVVSIDAHSRLNFAKQLALCGDGLDALAVAADGRIAISGSAMGTVVLTPAGDVAFAVEAFGKVAFDSRGELFVAGTLAADIGVDAFVTTFDAAGVQIGHLVFEASSVTIGGIAVDNEDHIAVAGFTGGSIDLFGTVISARTGIESGRVTGAFVFEMATDGSPIMIRDLGLVEANAVAFDAAGNLFVAGAATGDTGFFRIDALVEIDGNGVAHAVQAEADGRDLALAVDACGSVFVGSVQMDSPSAGAAIHALVTKISL